MTATLATDMESALTPDEKLDLILDLLAEQAEAIAELTEKVQNLNLSGEGFSVFDGN